VLWHCWLGHTSRRIVSRITYNVLNGTLNRTMLYYTTAVWRNHCLPAIVVMRAVVSCHVTWCCCCSGRGRTLVQRLQFMKHNLSISIYVAPAHRLVSSQHGISWRRGHPSSHVGKEKRGMGREKAGMRKSYLRCLERWIQSDVVGGINDMMSMIDMMVMTSSPVHNMKSIWCDLSVSLNSSHYSLRYRQCS